MEGKGGEEKEVRGKGWGDKKRERRQEARREGKKRNR